MTAWLRFAALAACLVVAPRAIANPKVTADELAAARRDGVSCKTLGERVDHFRSKTLAERTAKACTRDKWKLAVVACFLRDDHDDCVDLLPAHARARYAKAVDAASSTISQEQRQSAIESARKAGILGDAPSGGSFASLTAGCNAECEAEEAARKARETARDAIDTWAQAAYDQCTERTHNLLIEVTIKGGACTDVRINGERRAGPITKCLRALCAGADWSATPDMTGTGHGRTGPTDWSK